MTPEEARDRFSAAYDGMMPDEDKAAFDALLGADEALRDEYVEFTALLDHAHALDDEAVVAAVGPDVRSLLDSSHELLAENDLDDPPIDLVAGVQERIRQRSRGRFYRDRFSQQTGSRALLPLLMAVVMLLVVGVAYFMVSYVHDVHDIQDGGATDRALPAPR